MRGLLLVLIAALLLISAASADPVTVQLDALTRAQDFIAKRSSSANPDLAKNGDARSIGKGQTLVIADLEGPGVISHILKAAVHPQTCAPWPCPCSHSASTTSSHSDSKTCPDSTKA